MPIGTLTFKNINYKNNNDLVLYVNNNNLYFRNENIITSSNLNNYISNGLKLINGKITTTNSTNLFNIPCSLPAYKININNNEFNNAILAYQNLISEFYNYIIFNDMIITHITIIQSNLIETNYILNIINQTKNISHNININIDQNKIKRQNISNIIFNENDIIQIQIQNNDENVISHELLIILDGFYKDITNV